MHTWQQFSAYKYSGVTSNCVSACIRLVQNGIQMECPFSGTALQLLASSVNPASSPPPQLEMNHLTRSLWWTAAIIGFKFFVQGEQDHHSTPLSCDPVVDLACGGVSISEDQRMVHVFLEMVKN